MECAKDIVLELKEGQVRKHTKQEKKGVIHTIVGKMARHKVMTTILFATVGFMVLDVLLISSFVSVLAIK